MVVLLPDCYATTLFTNPLLKNKLLFVSHCFALSWPGRSCKRELVSTGHLVKLSLYPDEDSLAVETLVIKFLHLSS